MPTPATTKLLAENRRARFDYVIQETYEAGIELTGQEVKSAKAGKIHLPGSYVVAQGEELVLLNADIPPYQEKNTPPDYDPRRTRKLLLKKSEIKKLIGKLHEKGTVLVPLRVYATRNLVKIRLGLGKSRRQYDKRELLKKKAALREMRRHRGIK
ncbi:SsrA-binding protein SmpB [Candidatus Parcubacteria bacterium]|nr:MAG: SsrA-binding protein SmpB [Candidatus Parcubacteria bacterium]